LLNKTQQIIFEAQYNSISETNLIMFSDILSLHFDSVTKNGQRWLAGEVGSSVAMAAIVFADAWT